MEKSFYSAAMGAAAQQGKLNVISNNLANINNKGFKSQSAGFVDLLYDNLNRPSGEDTHMTQGSGARMEKTDISFTQGNIVPSDSKMDFAIVGDGFFAVQNPESGDIFYTRKGSFSLSENENGNFNLVANNGYFVLDGEGNPIVVEDSEAELPVAIYDFPKKEGFILVASNLFMATPRNGEVFVKEDASLVNSSLEASNVDFAYEMAKVIEAQRAYQMSLKMLQTSEEVTQTINDMRNV